MSDEIKVNSELPQKLATLGQVKDALGKRDKNIDSLKTDKADKTSLAQTDRKLDALWKLNQGISYEFQTDEAEAHQKTVPSGAKMANVKSIGGKTIVWNQLLTNISFNNVIWNSLTINGNSKDGITITGTASANSNRSIGLVNTIKNHKYLIYGIDKSIVTTDDDTYSTQAGNRIFTATNSKQLNISFYVEESSEYNTKNYPMLFDLTQMFGSGNEPSTPEEFEAMFPADYYPYNAGELMSAPVNEVIYLDTKNQEASYQIPQAILNLTGYGWSAGNVRNEVDWENKQYIQRVGKYTIDGSEIISKENTYWVMTVTDFEKPRPSTQNAICVNFKASNKLSGKWGDIFFRSGGNGFVFADSESKFANKNEVKDYFQQNNETIYYELNEEQIIDISDIIDNAFQEPIEVEAGGTLTFKNSHGDDYRIPSPSSEEYVISLAEVAK